MMQFIAKCAASVSKNGASWVLLKFAADSHLMGALAKEIGELKSGKNYKITIEEETDSEK